MEDVYNCTIFQHVITKSGESYTWKIGDFKAFNADQYLMSFYIPAYELIRVDENVWINAKTILKLWYTYQEVH